MKELLADFIADGLRGGKGGRSKPSHVRSLLPVARRATGIPIPALDNAQISAILEDEDSRVGH